MLDVMLYVILLFVFLEAALLFGILIDNSGYKKPIKRLDMYFEKGNYLNIEDEKDLRKINLSSQGLRSYFAKIEETTGRIGYFKKQRENLDIKLANAEILLTVEEFLAGTGFLVLISIYLGYAATSNILGGALAGVLVVVIVLFALKEKQRTRVEKLNKQLGDALDMMSGTLRAGYSFIQAMDTVSREMPKPISTEFSKVIKEIQVGGTMETALDNMLKRVYNEDLDLLITSVLIHRQIGGNLAEILDNISSTIRERIKLKGEVKVLTGQARISGMIIALLPVVFALIISFINPDHMKILINNRIGIFMIGLAVMGQIIGFIVIRRIMDIKY